MQITGTSVFAMPQVSQFAFAISGIRVSNPTGVMRLTFLDSDTGSFSLLMSGGFIRDAGILCAYNTVDTSIIEGYVSGQNLQYRANGVFGRSGLAVFDKLDRIQIEATPSVQCDLGVWCSPFNYSIEFDNTYAFTGKLRAVVSADVGFPASSPSFTFLNSIRQDVLKNDFTGVGVFIPTGSRAIYFSDQDIQTVEYWNRFKISWPTSFGNVGGNFASYRTGILGKTILILDESPNNEYYITTPFRGSWTGDGYNARFNYSDDITNFNLGFSVINQTYAGEALNGSISIKFEPLTSGNIGTHYISGWTTASEGFYSGKQPTLTFQEYYHVTGLGTPLSKLLFCTGCTGGIPVTYSGGSPTVEASGDLHLRTVRLSGVYGGLRYFRVVSGYVSADNGSGYMSAPNYLLGTGGACYSLPDYSGVETPQFKFASGYGATYVQAGGLTGVLVSASGTTSGSGVARLALTNIGMGYQAPYSPSVTFNRWSGDPFLWDASGVFFMATTTPLSFANMWGASINMGTGLAGMTSYGDYYSGQYGFSGQKNFTVQITLSGIPNTSPMSGRLTVLISGNGTSLTGTQTLVQSRSFDMSTGAMSAGAPQYSFQPLEDLQAAYGDDEFGTMYWNDAGMGENILVF